MIIGQVQSVYGEDLGILSTGLNSRMSRISASEDKDAERIGALV